MSSVGTVFRDADCFIKWFSGLSVLRIFWARSFRGVEVLDQDPLTLKIRWSRSRDGREALFMICVKDDAAACMRKLYRLCPGKEGCVGILATSMELEKVFFDRWSKVFLYSVQGSFLEPNREVAIEVYEPGYIGGDVLQHIKEIQRASWGFFTPPPPGDYVVVASLNNTPVASAYYNPSSSNIDYGIHVSKRYWRRRIGTRLLTEVASIAYSNGYTWLTVVRVLRINPSQADRRAIAFYRANNPVSELNIYRIRS